MRFPGIVAALILALPLAASEGNFVRSVRIWSQPEATRVVIETREECLFKHDRLTGPVRVYFDLMQTGMDLVAAPGKKYHSIPVNDKLLQRVRVAESTPGTTRLVFDLADPAAVYTQSLLSTPYRLVVEFRGRAGAADSSSASPPVPVPHSASPAAQPPSAAPSAATSRESLSRESAPPPNAGSFVAARSTPANTPANISAASAPPAASAAPRISIDQMRREATRASQTGRILDPPVNMAAVPARNPAPASAADAGSSGRAASSTIPVITPPPALPAVRGSRSMTRALGLKLGKIVIDPGHGGHDLGTTSPSGMHEKDLVLEVSRRLRQLLEDRLGAEVVLTRNDDSFLSLEQRTAFANSERADLFVSVHANSSPHAKASGPETFFLNFNPARDAMEVAARENASSGKTIFELQDLVKQIALNEKLAESKEFATRVQTALIQHTNKNADARVRDRGVKRAPFVVLIGAAMPSILTEIGFVTNAREEAQLKRAEYRQALAEALFRGISQYAGSLSRFQVATRTGPADSPARD